MSMVLFEIQFCRYNQAKMRSYWVRVCESHSVVSDFMWPRRLYSSWNSPGQNTGMDSLSLLQGIFPTHGSNPGLLHCRWILYQLSHKGSPGILEWVAYPFSSGSSWPKNWTRVSCIAGRFFTNWAIREPSIVWLVGYFKRGQVWDSTWQVPNKGKHK